MSHVILSAQEKMADLEKIIGDIDRAVSKGAAYIGKIRDPQLLLASLRDLNSLIGNTGIKNDVARQIAYLIATRDANIAQKPMLNTVLYGPPGVGKTKIGVYLARIWYALGCIESRESKKKVDTKEAAEAKVDELIRTLNGNNSGSINTSWITTVFSIVMIIYVIWLMGSHLKSKIFYLFIGVLLVIAGLFIFYMMISRNNEKIKAVKGKNEAKVDSSNDKIEGSSDGNKVDDKNVDRQDNTAGKGTLRDVNNATALKDDDVIRIASREDFVDKYVGWTDKKTRKLLEDNLGKVVFIDEAYSILSSPEDQYGIEALTTINRFLSEHPGEIIVIMAGYKDLLQNGLFSVQPGLPSRFMWHFDCAGYTNSELFQIFQIQLNGAGWKLSDPDKTRQIFRDNADAFAWQARDTERLVFFSQLEYSQLFLSGKIETRSISPLDVERAIAKLRQNNIHQGKSIPSPPRATSDVVRDLLSRI